MIGLQWQKWLNRSRFYRIEFCLLAVGKTKNDLLVVLLDHLTMQAREKRRLEYQDRRLANDAEHAKVTRAMRYDVLRRDNFHCVRCGRGKEDGVKLHVDHIVPVSRGGKSVMSNLQTLCENCNCGKGNRYEE